MADADAPAADEGAEMSLLEWEEAMADETHPRHAAAERIAATTVRPAMQKISEALKPRLPRAGFASIRRTALGDVGPAYKSLSTELGNSVTTQRERVGGIMDEYFEALAAKEAEIAAEKAEELKRREADRAEARKQHRVIVVLTVVTAVLTLIATAAAVVTVFVSA